MSGKPVIPRALARADLDAAIDHYLREAGGAVALTFVDAVEQAYRAIAARPAAGSLRVGQELGLPDLRSRRLKRFPWLIFYIERTDHIDVWRLLHAQRDIPAWLAPKG